LSDLTPVLTQCHACRSPIADAIDAKIKAGLPLRVVSEFTRDVGQGLSRQTLSHHKNAHLMTEHARAVQVARTQLRKQRETIKAKTGDLAPLVRDIVYAGVEEGEIVPTLSEGLRAQEALDRRAEKGADRDLMLTMAQVLGGSLHTVPVIEGQWIQLDAERAEDEAMFDRLSDGRVGEERLRPEPTYRPH